MVGILAASGFIAMVLAPCAMAIAHKRDERAEAEAQAPLNLTAAIEPAPAVVVTTESTAIQQKPVPIVRAAAPVAAKSLQELAAEADANLERAQIAAAQAKANLLIENSREAARRVEAAAKLAASAERELLQATIAADRAEMMRARRRIAEEYLAERDYLPADHPSLDFPRSRTTPRRAA